MPENLGAQPNPSQESASSVTVPTDPTVQSIEKPDHQPATLSPAVSPPHTEKPAKPRVKPLHKPTWQERLLPLMRGLIVGLTAFFFFVTLVQISYLHYTIQKVSEIDLGVGTGQNLNLDNVSFQEQLSGRELELLGRLEAAVIERRYHLASAGMMSSLWMRYLGFVTGMILALVGASFVLGRLREQQSEITGKFTGIDLSLRSASPGIILVVLGVVLMFATILDKDTIDTAVKGVYLPRQTMIMQATSTINFQPLSTLPAEEFLETPGP